MFLRTIALLALFTTPLLAEAAPATYKELVEYLVQIMNYTVGTLVVAGLVFYLYGAAQHVWKAEEGNTQEFTQFLLMGVIALFVMVSIWGILALLQNTFLGGGGTGMFTPSSGGGFSPCNFGDANCVVE